MKNENQEKLEDNAFYKKILKRYRGNLELAKMYLKDSNCELSTFLRENKAAQTDCKFLTCLLTHIKQRIADNGFFENGDCLRLPDAPTVCDRYVCTEEVGKFVAELQDFAYSVATGLDKARYWLEGFRTDDENAGNLAIDALQDVKHALMIVRLTIPMFSAWLAKHGGDKSKDAFAEMREAYWHTTQKDDPQGGFCTDAKSLGVELQKATRGADFRFPLNTAVSAIRSLSQAGGFQDVCDLYDGIYEATTMFTTAVIHFCAMTEESGIEAGDNHKEANNGK